MINKTNGFFDGMMDHAAAKQMDNDDLLALINETYPGRDLFGFGTSWEDDSKYILKAKGRNGDVILGWEGVHDAR